MNCHTTIPEILNMFILSLVLVPTITHAITLNFFLTFLAQQKSSHQDSSHSVLLIKFILLPIYNTPTSKSNNTF